MHVTFRAILSAACLAFINAASATAQPARLPIAQGVWVKTDTACNAAFIAHVYTGSRFGSVYLYGPGQTMGPANETEVLTHVGKGTQGFTTVNDGPLEVAARPKGQAAVRAYSLSEGPQWTDIVRLCPPASLSARFRTGLQRVGLIPK